MTEDEKLQADIDAVEKEILSQATEMIRGTRSSVDKELYVKLQDLKKTLHNITITIDYRPYAEDEKRIENIEKALDDLSRNVYSDIQKQTLSSEHKLFILTKERIDSDYSSLLASIDEKVEGHCRLKTQSIRDDIKQLVREAIEESKIKILSTVTELIAEAKEEVVTHMSDDIEKMMVKELREQLSKVKEEISQEVIENIKKEVAKEISVSVPKEVPKIKTDPVNPKVDQAKVVKKDTTAVKKKVVAKPVTTKTVKK